MPDQGVFVCILKICLQIRKVKRTQYLRSPFQIPVQHSPGIWHLVDFIFRYRLTASNVLKWYLTDIHTVHCGDTDLSLFSITYLSFYSTWLKAKISGSDQRSGQTPHVQDGKRTKHCMQRERQGHWTQMARPLKPIHSDRGCFLHLPKPFPAQSLWLMIPHGPKILQLPPWTNLMS